MNIPVRHATAATKLAIVDCDIHPAFRKPSDLYPFLPAQWREHMITFGEHLRQGLSGQLAWPRMSASGLRVDAFPEDGPPGSDLELMRRQHLDANGVEYGMLMQLSKGGMEERNLEFAAALSHAINEWQLETFVKPEPRLRAGIVVPQEDAAFAVKEIEHRADRSVVFADHHLAAVERSARSPALLADLRGGAALQPSDRAARPGLQRRPRFDRVGLADLLHGGALRRDHRHAEHADEPGVRGCVRALPEAEDRARRGRFRLGAGAVLADGQALGAPAGGNAAREASAVGICPRACLVHHAADRGARQPAASGRGHRMAWLGPADVLDRLSALGLRRPAAHLQVRDD